MTIFVCLTKTSETATYLSLKFEFLLFDLQAELFHVDLGERGGAQLIPQLLHLWNLNVRKQGRFACFRIGQNGNHDIEQSRVVLVVAF